MSTLKIQFPEDFNERYDAYKTRLLKSSHGVVSTDHSSEKHGIEMQNNVHVNNDLNNIEIKLTEVDKDDVGFLFYDGGKIKIGPAKNIPFKMVKIFSPFGNPIAIDKAFDMTTSDHSKHKGSPLSPAQKKDILRARIKDLQNILPDKKIKVRLKFNENGGTAFIEAYK